MSAAAGRRWVLADIAAELGLARSTVEAYRSRQQMPPATGTVGRTPYWSQRTIGPWIEQQRTSRKHIDPSATPSKTPLFAQEAGPQIVRRVVAGQQVLVHLTTGHLVERDEQTGALIDTTTGEILDDGEATR